MPRLKLRENRSGRVKGLPSTARETIELTATALGGADGLAAWAAKNNKNETVFWTKIFVHLLRMPEQMRDGVTVGPPEEDVRKKFVPALDASNNTGGTTH